jgi:hypothetical protein
MTVDLLDAAFLRRLADRPRPAPAQPHPIPAPPRRPVAAARAAAPRVPAPQPAACVASPPIVAPSPPAPPVREEPIVERLLAQAPDEWAALAAHVEAARQRGRRVIAVAGGRAGEGRTTLVRCLAATLRARGRDVSCAAAHELALVAAGPDGRGPTHDKRIVLVDSGIWFPPGPIRRSVLQVESLGCEAAILVRRSGAAGGAARQAALEALGLEVLGEVLTFTSPLAADDIRDGGVAA